MGICPCTEQLPEQPKYDLLLVGVVAPSVSLRRFVLPLTSKLAVDSQLQTCTSATYCLWPKRSRNKAKHGTNARRAETRCLKSKINLSLRTCARVDPKSRKLDLRHASQGELQQGWFSFWFPSKSNKPRGPFLASDILEESKRLPPFPYFAKNTWGKNRLAFELVPKAGLVIRYGQL